MKSFDHNRMEESDKKNSTSIAPDIYFCTTNKEHDQLGWYVINGDGTTSKTEVLSPHLSRPPHDCNLSRHVVIGSTIYIIGGYVRDGTHEHYNKTRAVYCIDTRYPEKGWNEIAPMNNARICPSAFVVDGKIYVYGGCNYDCESYVEVYDPICNKWDNVHRMTDGRDLPCGRVSTLIVLINGESRENDMEKKVLLMASRTSSLYIYDLVSGSCDAINENLRKREVKSLAILNGVVYCVYGWRGSSKIYAYDLEHLDSAPKSVFSMWGYAGFDNEYDRDKWICFNSRIVSLGNGILAVLCRVKGNHRVTNACKIGCFKFQMVKGRRSSGELYVNEVLLSSSTHFVNGGFYTCLIMFANPPPVADESEKYMLVNGTLKKRLSSAYSSATTESNINIHQLHELLKKTMAENEQRIEKRVLQCIKSRFDSMETRIVKRVKNTRQPKTDEQLIWKKKNNQPMQQIRCFTTGFESTTNVSDPNTRYSRGDLQTNTKITSLNQVMVDVVDMISTRTPDIYVCGGCNWYVIKNVGDNSSSQCAIPFPLLSQTPHDFEDSAHVVIGSIIYMVGGSYGVNLLDEYISGPTVLKTKEVYCMDLGDPQPEWKEACPMKNERDQPYAFVVDGKIYVIGGFENKKARSMYDKCDDDHASYVEVYDPICDKWDNAPPMKYGHRLPKSIRGHMVIDGEGDKEKKVLLFGSSNYSSTKTYLYEIESGSCEVIELNRSNQHLVASVIVDGTLYCLEADYDKNYIVAYELDNLESDPKLVTGVEKYLPSRETNEIHMVSLDDGKLALLWSVESRTHEKFNKIAVFNCYKFQMSKGIKANGELTFDAHLLSFSTDTVNDHRIEKCLTVWTPSDANLDDKSAENAERTSNDTNLSVNEIRDIVSDRDRAKETVAIHKEKPQLPYQSNKSEVVDPLRVEDAEINMHKLVEMIQEVIAENEQRNEHHIVQHIETCIESTESRILTEYLAEATTSKKTPNLGKRRGNIPRFRG